MSLKVGRWYKPFEAYTHHYYLILPRERQIVIVHQGFGNVDFIRLYDAFRDLEYTPEVGELQPKDYRPPYLTRTFGKYIIRKIFKA